MAPGILYVTMAPALPAAQFHDWYNNEHGPGRLHLPEVFKNGFRYRATDGESPEWMAIYDVTDMKYMLEDVYTSLRKDPKQSQRERDTMAQIKVTRRFYDLLNEVKKPGFNDLENVGFEESKESQTVLIAVLFTLKNSTAEGAAELGKWYDEEHISMVSKVPGWRRSRRFVSSSVEPPSNPKDTEYLALHEYDPQNGLDASPEFRAATNTPWRTKIFDTIVATKARRTYELYYTFGPGPRDLASLSSPEVQQFESAYQGTKTHPSTSAPAIESVITTPDGVQLPYRLEGNTDAHAPLILFINCILANHSIWTSFLQSFLSSPTGKRYRVLRYDARGRSSLPPSIKSPVTVDLLAQDALCLLDALRVPKAHVIGVSLGGATTLCLALKHPERILSFISCDTNSFTPPSNPKAWDERIAMADKTGAKNSSGEPIVGADLAKATAERWFAGPHEGAAFEATKKGVHDNSLHGFKAAVKALYDYDFRPLMKSGKVKGIFVVGAGDGVLPKSMPEMAAAYGDGVECKVVEGAGHVPMVEKPEEFGKIVERFLS